MLSNTFVCPLTALNGGLHPFAQIGFVSLRVSILVFLKRHSVC